MLNEIVEVTPSGGTRLLLRFDDGATGELDLATILRFDGVFAALRDPGIFIQACVDPEIGTVIWPNGAALCPDVLHAHLTGQPLPGTASLATAS